MANGVEELLRGWRVGRGRLRAEHFAAAAGTEPSPTSQGADARGAHRAVGRHGGIQYVRDRQWAGRIVRSTPGNRHLAGGSLAGEVDVLAVYPPEFRQQIV